MARLRRRAEQVDAVGDDAVGAEAPQALGRPFVVDGVAERAQAGGVHRLHRGGIPERVVADHGDAAQASGGVQPIRVELIEQQAPGQRGSALARAFEGQGLKRCEQRRRVALPQARG